MNDPAAALELIRQVKLERLIEFEGCLCGSFSIKGVEVHLSCRKSSDAPRDYYGTTVRVTGNYFDGDRDGLIQVAQEIVEQLKRYEYPVRVRFNDYRHDHGDMCCYCDGPKTGSHEYLCAEHAADLQASTYYNFPTIEWNPPE